MLTTADLTNAVAAMAAAVDPIRDELNAADRRLGDGDTGMTVAQIIAAWSAAAAVLPPDPGAALVVLGRETGRASGSSLGAVLATALSAAGRSVRGKEALTPDDLVTALAAAVAAITERSGATPGDKCILDSLLAIRDALAAAGDTGAQLATALAAARRALDEFRGRESRLGRARMYGPKSAGHDDPGMLAAVLLLEAVRGEGGVAEQAPGGGTTQRPRPPHS